MDRGRAIVLHRVTRMLFVLSIIVLFGTVSLRWLVSDVGWYQSSFAANGVPERTGISPTDLGKASEEISGYLLFSRDRVDDITVSVRGQSKGLFNEREVFHFGHVRDLLQRFYMLQFLAVAYALAYLVAKMRASRGGVLRLLAANLRAAGVATLLSFAVFGVMLLVAFDYLFLVFHIVSYDSDCWLLNPATDNLIMMFPQAFWNASALRLAGATVVQAAGAVVVGTLVLRNPHKIFTTH